MTPTDATEIRLRAILDRVDGWLRYAEAKNAGVIVVSGTASAAILAFGRPLSDLAVPVQIGVTLSQVAFLAALVIGIASFLPQTRLEEGGRGAAKAAGPKRPGAVPKPDAPVDQSSEGANLFFYAHLAKFEPEDLAAAVAALGNEGEEAPVYHPVHVMLAAQVCADARITVRKLRLYSWAAWMAMAGAVALAVTLLLRLAGTLRLQ